MNKKVSLGVTISLIAIGCAITFVLTMTISLNMVNSKVIGLSEREEIFRKIKEVDTYVRANAIAEIDENDILDGLIYGYIAGLGDKYASYLPVESFYQVQQSDSGILLGIGVDIVSEESGYIKVSKVYDNSPAKTAGLKVDDVIIEVDGNDVKSIGTDDAISRIRGEDGTRVAIKIRRSGEDLSFNLVRQKIDIPSIATKIIDNIAYIRVITFNAKTADEFILSINNMINVGVKGFVFDLRQNTGGSVEALRKMLERILPPGVIATAEYRNGVVNTLIECVSDDTLDLPMVTLVDGRTASASELFACALRDAGKAKMVGTTTYGKAVMQYTHQLKDSSAITITTAKCYTAKTPFYDGVGLKPDFIIESAAGEELNLELINPDTDIQLSKAMTVLQSYIDAGTSGF